MITVLIIYPEEYGHIGRFQIGERCIALKWEDIPHAPHYLNIRKRKEVDDLTHALKRHNDGEY